jgi:hypothetical protein
LVTTLFGAADPGGTGLSMKATGGASRFYPRFGETPS